MPSFRFTAIRSNEIDYRRPDASTRTLTLVDALAAGGDSVKVAIIWQDLIQAEIDKEDRLDSLPVDDPEHDDNFTNLAQAEAFFATLYPAGNVFIERRQGVLWRVTRNEVVGVTWDAVNSVYNVKVSTIG